MRKIFNALFLILLLISCSGNEKKIKKEPKITINKNNDSITLQKKEANFSELLIDVQKIKKQVEVATTTFLSKKESSIFLNRKENKFYGQYNLFINDKEEIPTKRVGKLIIYDSINPYIYEKNTDEFVEITLDKPGINLYDGKLKIGMSFNELLNVLGEDYIENGNSLIYSKNNKTAFFKIEKKLVVKLKIGIYRHNLDSSKIIENSNW